MNDYDQRQARVAKALAEVELVQALIGAHESTEAVLAAEVKRMHGVRQRIVVLVAGWREVAAEQMTCAAAWRTQGESFVWHAIRAENSAVILETQAKILEAIIKTL